MANQAGCVEGSSEQPPDYTAKAENAESRSEQNQVTYPPPSQPGLHRHQQEKQAYSIKQREYQQAGNLIQPTGAPLPYSAPPLQTQMIQTNQRQVVVKQQPQHRRRRRAGTISRIRNQPAVTQRVPVDRGITPALILAIIASFCVFFCGSYFSLACTISAIYLAMQSQEAKARGDQEVMENQRNMSYCCSVTGIMFSLIAVFVVVMITILHIARQPN